MSKEYISKNVSEIFNDKELEFPLNSAMASAWILGNLKGVNLKIYDVRNISSLGDYYVMGSATNIRQAHSMTEEISTQLKKHGMKVISTEGKADSDWILLDLGDILVHIFLEVSRGNYNLESLWDEAEAIEIPNSYYFSENDNETEDTDKNYF